MPRSLPVIILVTVLTVLGQVAVIPAPASADHSPEAPPLTDEQLEQLRAVDTWEIEYRRTFSYTASGSWSFTNSLGNTVTGSATHERETIVTMRVRVTGDGGCIISGIGCRVEEGNLDHFTVTDNREQMRTQTVEDGCETDDGLTSSTINDESQTSAHGTLTGPDLVEALSDDGLWIDYSTNPPRAAAAFDAFFTAQLSSSFTSTCPTTEDSSSSRELDFRYLAQFLHDPFHPGDEFHINDPDLGDTQVRVEDGQFVIRGQGEQIINDKVCASGSTCSDTFLLDRTGVHRGEWVARAVTDEEADLDVEVTASEERLSGAPEEELPLEFTVVVTNNGPETAPAVVDVDLVETPDPPPPPGEVQLFVPPLTVTSTTCSATGSTCEGSSGDWQVEFAALEAGESRTITVSTVVQAGAGGSVAAAAGATIPDAGLIDPIGENNRDEVEIPVKPHEAELQIDSVHATPSTVIAPPDVPVPVQFLILVMNSGPSPTPATVSFSLLPSAPVTMQFTSCSAAGAFLCNPDDSLPSPGAKAIYGGPGGGLEEIDAKNVLVTYHVTVSPGVDSGSIIARAAITPEGIPSLDPDGLAAIDPQPHNNVHSIPVQVIPVPPDTPPDGVVDVVGDDGTVQPGDELEVSGDGFEANAGVNIVFQSDPVLLATVQTDTDGSFSTLVQIPTDGEDGQHRIIAMGPAPDGSPRVLAAPIIIRQKITNQPPAADAGGSYEVDEGDTLTLNGSGSSDPDGDELTHSWAFEGQTFEGTIVDISVVDDLETTATLTVDDGRGGTDTAMANVTVVNVPPAVIADDDLEVNEGEPVTLAATFSDRGVADAPWSVAWDFGDGSDPVTVTTDTQDDIATDHVYLDDGEYEAEVCVTDKDGDTGCDSLVVTVRNVPPEISDLALSEDVIDEGGNVTLSGTFTDPGVLDTHQVTVGWSDGSEDTLDLSTEARSFAVAHTYVDNRPDDAPYPIAVTIVDDDDGEDNDSTQVTVRNVVPEVTTLSLSDSSIEEGDDITLSGTFIDPGVLDTHEVAVDWGDGSESAALDLSQGDRAFALSHRYLDNPPDEADGSVPISVVVTDKDGGEGSNATAVQVRNVPPSVSVSGDTIDEGEVATVTATFTDPGILDTHTATADWGDGSPPEAVDVEQGAGSGNLTATHAYGDDGTYSVTVTVTDNDGGVASETAVVEVANVAPVVDLDTSGVIAFHDGDAFLGRVGVTQSHEASGTDPGSDDLTFTWDFEVSETSTSYFNDGAGADPDLSPSGTFPFSASDTVSVTFDAPGVHTLTVMLADDDGGTDEANMTKVVTDDAADVRGLGFWRHQYSGQGRAHYSAAELDAFLDIGQHASGVFSERTNAETFDAAHDVLSTGGPGMRTKAEAQALAAWLNFAAGGVGWTDRVDTDSNGEADRAFHDVMDEVDAILTDENASEAELERAKDLAEAVNTGGSSTGDGEGQAGGANNGGNRGNGKRG